MPRGPTSARAIPLPINQILLILAHPDRLTIIAILSQGAEHVSALAERLELDLPMISKHLASLRDAGIVQHTKVKRQRYYHLTDSIVASIEHNTLLLDLRTRAGERVVLERRLT